VHTSANAGMSSVRHVSKRAHRMAKVSYGRFIHVGLVGPKPRPKGVGDGQTVYIPLPLEDDTSSGAGWGRSSVALELLRLSLQVTLGSPDGTEKWEIPRATAGDSIDPRLLEKPGDECRERPYRKPTLVAGCKSTKVDE
jgi:hypothetical protein